MHPQSSIRKTCWATFNMTTRHRQTTTTTTTTILVHNFCNFCWQMMNCAQNARMSCQNHSHCHTHAHSHTHASADKGERNERLSFWFSGGIQGKRCAQRSIESMLDCVYVCTFFDSASCCSIWTHSITHRNWLQIFAFGSFINTSFDALHTIKIVCLMIPGRDVHPPSS